MRPVFRDTVDRFQWAQVDDSHILELEEIEEPLEEIIEDDFEDAATDAVKNGALRLTGGHNEAEVIT